MHFVCVIMNSQSKTNELQIQKGSDILTQKKKELMSYVTKIYKGLPEHKKQRALGFMQGLACSMEESKTKDTQCVSK